MTWIMAIAKDTGFGYGFGLQRQFNHSTHVSCMPFDVLRKSFSGTEFHFNPPTVPAYFIEPFPVSRLDRSSLVFWNHVTPGARLSVAFALNESNQPHVVIEASKDTTVVALARPSRGRPSFPTAFRMVIGPDRSVSYFRGRVNQADSFEPLDSENPGDAETLQLSETFLHELAGRIHRMGPPAFPVSSPSVPGQWFEPKAPEGPLTRINQQAKGGLFKNIRRSGQLSGAKKGPSVHPLVLPARDHLLDVFKSLSE